MREQVVKLRIYFQQHVLVANRLLPYWRSHRAATVEEMTRVETGMAEDAYSLLCCLDERQDVNSAPDVAFSAGVNELMVRFAVRAGDLDGAIDGIKWNFGDSSVSNEISPIHIYKEPGDYLVSCRVWDDNGVSVTD